MLVNSKVIWSEGLFLQPQHLQQQDRYVENLISERSKVSELISWGIIEYEIDHNLLLMGKIAFTRCKGVFPDGTMFDSKTNSILPEPIDAMIDSNESIIYLALPLIKSDVPEISTQDNDSLSYRYKSESQEIMDNIGGTKNLIEMLIGKLALRIKLDTEELGGFNCLPIAKIKTVLPNRTIILVNDFIPACLNVNTIPRFIELNKELLATLQLTRNKLERLKNIYDKNNGNVYDFLLLLIINRAQKILKVLTEKHFLHPETLYLYFVELYSNLASFDNSDTGYVLPAYQHHNLQISFEALLIEIKKYLSSLTRNKTLSLPLESISPSISVCRLNNNHELILGVNADVDLNVLRNDFHHFVKIASAEAIQDLVNYALPGLSLFELHVEPHKITLEDGYIYYSFNTNHPQWQEIISSQTLAIYVGKIYPQLKLKVWAIMEQQGA